MTKNKRKKRAPQKRSRKHPSPAELVRGYLARPGDIPEEARTLASELLDEGLNALSAGDVETAIDAIRGSLEANPRDPDGLQVFVDLVSDSPAQAAAALQLIVDTTAKDLGDATFRKDRGHFWGLIETRPFMRAKMRLAETWRAADEHDAAIAQYQEMLSLNPNDNQGNRYPLLGLYLSTGRFEDAGNLLTEYDEPSAIFTWGRVLLQLLDNDTRDSQALDESLQQAQEINAYVAPLLLGALEPPAHMPSFYSPGGPNEAVIALDYLEEAWITAGTEPLEWLAERVRL